MRSCSLLLSLLFLFCAVDRDFAAATSRAAKPLAIVEPRLAQGSLPPWTGLELPPDPQPRAHMGQKADHP